MLWINPRLADGVKRLQLLIRYRAHTLELTITPEALEVSAAHCKVPAMKLAVRGTKHVLHAGERRAFSLSQPES